MIYLLYGPSGSGKSMAQKIFESYGITIIVTITTRDIRDGEIDGIDYHFKSRAEFQKALRDNLIIEHCEYNGNYYGTNYKCFQDITDGVLVTEVTPLELYKRFFDCTLVYVDTPFDLRLSRGGSRVQERAEQDSYIIQKKNMADVVLYNHSDEILLRKQIADILRDK